MRKWGLGFLLSLYIATSGCAMYGARRPNDVEQEQLDSIESRLEVGFKEKTKDLIGDVPVFIQDLEEHDMFAAYQKQTLFGVEYYDFMVVDDDVILDDKLERKYFHELMHKVYLDMGSDKQKEFDQLYDNFQSKENGPVFETFIQNTYPDKRSWPHERFAYVCEMRFIEGVLIPDEMETFFQEFFHIDVFNNRILYEEKK